MESSKRMALPSPGVERAPRRSSAPERGMYLARTLEELRAGMLGPGMPHEIRIQIPGLNTDPEWESSINKWKSECGCGWGATAGTVLVAFFGVVFLLRYWVLGIPVGTAGWLWGGAMAIVGGVLGKIAGLAYARIQLRQIFKRISKCVE